MSSNWVGAGLVACAAVFGVACGGDGAATSTTPVVTVMASNYETLPPATTTIPASTVAPNTPGSVTEVETDYVVAAGDLPATIANKYKITLQALLDANGWVLEGQFVPAFPPPGTTIKIPAGATIPGAPPVDPTATTAPAGGTGAATTTTAAPAGPTTTAGGSGSCGTYTVTADDTSRIAVAEKFDTTVAKLDAANANTPGYSSFYPGLVIKLPC